MEQEKDDPVALLQAERGRMLKRPPADRIQLINRRLKELQEAIQDLSSVRLDAIAELRDSSTITSQSELAQQLGMTPARVSQLLASKPAPERSFLTRGADPLTIILGLKHDQEDSTERAVEDELERMAKRLDIEVKSEDIGLSGHVDLSRPNVLLACGPRLSPAIATVLQSDTFLQFDHDSAHWYLKDLVSKKEYRSPRDGEIPENADYGYLGRVRRLDGKGTFLCIAGLHSSGTLGVAHFLANNLEHLRQRVGRKRFSALIRSDYDPTTKVITHSEELALYLH